jgi:glutamate N-acetyltransferase/amino-acid N-acetyltransferase
VSVTAAKGFVAAGVHAGIRRSAKDLALVRSTVPAVGTAMLTVNRVQAAPVLVTKEHLEVAEPQAIVVNSGVANAATGERGMLDAIATAAEAGRLLDLQAEEVLVLSTGVIGPLLPLERVVAGLQEAAPALSAPTRRRRSSPPIPARRRRPSRSTASRSAAWRRAPG